MSALFDSDSKVNGIHPTFAQKLRLAIRPTDVGAEKIDGSMLDTYGMVVSAFLITDKANQIRFLNRLS